MTDAVDKTREQRGIVEGARVVVTKTCRPTGFTRAASVGERGVVWAARPTSVVYPIIVSIEGRLAWAGDVEVCDG